MRYPEDEFEELLAKARLVEHLHMPCLLFSGHPIPISHRDPNTLDPARLGSEGKKYWVNGLTGPQRETLRQKLVALRVEARLKG